MNAVIPTLALPAAAKPWKPRASSLGYYMKCLWRAAQDRLIHEGKLDPRMKEPQDDTSYADFGTVIHFALQDGTRCTFPGPAASHAPTQAEIQSASKLFASDLELMNQRARQCAALAMTMLPKSPDGLPWRAEDELENDILTGHTDFFSQDGSTLGDLKSTSKPPPKGKVKTEHLVQVCGYKLLRPTAKRAFVLYVDSMRAAWATLIWIDFTKPAMQFYLERVHEFAAMLMTDKLLDVAYPNLGDHCQSTWCPYPASCYKAYMPGPGSEYQAAVARRPVGQMAFAPLKIG